MSETEIRDDSQVKLLSPNADGSAPRVPDGHRAVHIGYISIDEPEDLTLAETALKAEAALFQKKPLDV